MTLEELNQPLTKLKGIGSKTVFKLKKYNIETIKDLLYFFPYKYIDLSNPKKINEVKINETSAIIGTIKNLKLIKTPFKKIYIVSAYLEDETSKIKIIWFNQPYLLKILRNNQKILVYGKIIKNKYGLHISSPEFKILEKNKKIEKEIIPVYYEISSISSNFFYKLISNIFEEFDIENLIDPLPEIVRIKAGVIDLGKAFSYIHKPKSLDLIDLAKKRFLFEEMFYIQLKIQKEKILLQEEKSPVVKVEYSEISEFLKNLDLELTNGQKIVLEEIINDLKSNKIINRLIQGETGSGKTLIAEIISLIMVKNNYNVILMAPTEILARQHFNRFLNDFKYYNIGIGLMIKKMGYYGLKGFKTTKKKEDILRLIIQGKINILIGTHSLLEVNLEYPNIGLIIIDEQQRFGVEQRKKLIKNSNQDFIPHFISLTATPIPRTLYLTLYGDLEVSILKDKPFNQKEIKTKVIKPENLDKVWSFIDLEIKHNHQAFIICPRVEKTENKNLEVKNVKEEYEKIKKIFPNYKIGILHGKMNSREKEKILKEMLNNEINILVASSVVEVGIDFPLATVIVILGAERFGLSQLHQLRGRVGRSIHQGYCFLVPEKYSPLAYKRLKVLEESQDAFYISEKDLEIRGPGELLGKKQAGFPDLAMQALKNIELVEKAKNIAQYFVKYNPTLQGYPLLRIELSKRDELILH